MFICDKYISLLVNNAPSGGDGCLTLNLIHWKPCASHAERTINTTCQALYVVLCNRRALSGWQWGRFSVNGWKERMFAQHHLLVVSLFRERFSKTSYKNIRAQHQPTKTIECQSDFQGLDRSMPHSVRRLDWLLFI